MDIGCFPSQVWKILERLESRGLVRPANEHRVAWELAEPSEGSCRMMTPAQCSPPGSSSSGPAPGGTEDESAWPGLGPPVEHIQFDVPFGEPESFNGEITFWHLGRNGPPREEKPDG